MAQLTKNEMSELNDLCFSWDSAYDIVFDGDGFSASRLDGSGELLTAASPAALREKIREDYRAWRTAVILDRALILQTMIAEADPTQTRHVTVTPDGQVKLA